jgi:hypothetical protein
MRYFKYLTFAILAIFAVTSCHKSGVAPAKSTTTSTTGSTGSTSTTPIDTNILIHTISFNAPAQFAAVSVSGTQLNITYYENVTLFIPKEGAILSYAIHLKEDFSLSALVNYQFETYDAYGDITQDWVDDNLNNVTAKTEKDTTINDTLKEKITVQRPFLFSRNYTTSQAAIAGQDSLLARTKDNIVFSSYVYFTTTYPTYFATSNLYYVKGN